MDQKFNLYPLSFFRCDKHFDCDDSSDEMDCKDYDPTTKCHENQFVCHNGACIDPNALCDGFKVTKKFSLKRLTATNDISPF